MPSDTWGDFYEESDCLKNVNRYVHMHREMLASIVSEKPKSILEAGCGSAIFSIHLSKLGFSCVAADNDPRILEIAGRNNAALGGNVTFVSADIGHLPYSDHSFDIIFSQGVMEHFSDTEIRRYLDEQLRVGRVVVFSVPHFFYGHRDFGNERLYTKRRWEKILRDYRVVESLCYYRIRRKRTLFLKLPQMYLAKIAS